jgi:hypothetical protein
MGKVPLESVTSRFTESSMEEAGAPPHKNVEKNAPNAAKAKLSLDGDPMEEINLGDNEEGKGKRKKE